MSDHSIQAHYARAYAYHRTGHPDEANAEVAALHRRRPPHDPYFLELQGQVLLESGHPAEAVTVLREAVQRSNDTPLIATLLGHALISTEDPANFEEAKRVLRVAVGRDNDNPFAWYQLGIVYDREGDEARAALATAERYNLQGQPGLALPNAERAMMGLPAHTHRLDPRAGHRDGLAQRRPAHRPAQPPMTDLKGAPPLGGWKMGLLAGLGRHPDRRARRLALL